MRFFLRFPAKTPNSTELYCACCFAVASARKNQRSLTSQRCCCDSSPTSITHSALVQPRRLHKNIQTPLRLRHRLRMTVSQQCPIFSRLASDTFVCGWVSHELATATIFSRSLPADDFFGIVVSSRMFFNPGLRGFARRCHIRAGPFVAEFSFASTVSYPAPAFVGLVFGARPMPGLPAALDNHAAPGRGDLPHGLMQCDPHRTGASQTRRRSDIHCDSTKFPRRPRRRAPARVMLVVQLRAVQIQIEIAVVGRQFDGLDALDQFLRVPGVR